MIGSGRGDNPLSLEDQIQKQNELHSLWQRGRGAKSIINNVEAIVERMIMREAEKLIDQNRDSAMVVPIKRPSNYKHNKVMSNDILDGLDEIEDLEDLDASGKGFHFYGAGANQKQPQAGPTLAAIQSPIGGIA